MSQWLVKQKSHGAIMGGAEGGVRTTPVQGRNLEWPLYRGGISPHGYCLLTSPLVVARVQDVMVGTWERKGRARRDTKISFELATFLAKKELEPDL